MKIRLEGQPEMELRLGRQAGMEMRLVKGWTLSKLCGTRICGRINTIPLDDSKHKKLGAKLGTGGWFH